MYYLRTVLETQGPFDGVWGFSQGAATAAILCALVARPWLHPAFSSTPSPGVPWPPAPFKFAVFCSGYLPLDRRCESWFDSPVNTPALHVLGRSDVVAPNERTLANVPRFSNSRVEWHEGGCVSVSLSRPSRPRARTVRTRLTFSPALSQPLHPAQAALCAHLQGLHPQQDVPRRAAAALSALRPLVRRQPPRLALRLAAHVQLAVPSRGPAYALASDGHATVSSAALSAAPSSSSRPSRLCTCLLALVRPVSPQSFTCILLSFCSVTKHLRSLPFGPYRRLARAP